MDPVRPTPPGTPVANHIPPLGNASSAAPSDEYVGSVKSEPTSIASLSAAASPSLPARLREAGLKDSQAVAHWISVAHPSDLTADQFADQLLVTARAHQAEGGGNLDRVVGDVIRFAETVRRAEFGCPAGECLGQAGTALKWVYGPLAGHPDQVSQYRGLMGVVGDARVAAEMLGLGRTGLDAGKQAEIANQTVRHLREQRPADGQRLSAEAMLDIHARTVAEYS